MTEARTRVLIEFSDTNRKWSTVGVHENIINTSWVHCVMDSYFL